MLKMRSQWRIRPHLVVAAVAANAVQRHGERYFRMARSVHVTARLDVKQQMEVVGLQLFVNTSPPLAPLWAVSQRQKNKRSK